MDEKKKPVSQEQPEKKLSRTTLTFYIVALFSVAIALILISYVAQSRADRQLESLSTQLNEQQTVAQGATQKMEALQKQLDEQQQVIDQLTALYGTDIAGLPEAARQTADEHTVYALLARINAQLLAENDADAVAAYDELVQNYSEERLLGNAPEQSFGADINKLFENAQQQIQAVRGQDPNGAA